jgi:hypothetical protein
MNCSPILSHSEKRRKTSGEYSAVEEGPRTKAQAEEMLDWLEAHDCPAPGLMLTADGLIRFHALT